MRTGIRKIMRRGTVGDGLTESWKSCEYAITAHIFFSLHDVQRMRSLLWSKFKRGEGSPFP